MPTSLYINAVFYDALNHVLFEDRLYIQKVAIKFRNKIHNNVNDLDDIKFSGKVKNTGDDGIVLLGAV